MTTPTQPFTGMDWQTYHLQSIGGSTVAVDPTLPTLTLSDEDEALVRQLETLVTSRRYGMEILDAYYSGTFRIQDLGISIPPQMRTLRVALGWPRVVVDAIDERLNVEGFRFPGATDADADLWEGVWLPNNLDSESHLAHLDSMVFGTSYVAVGSGPDHPIVTVESPLDVSTMWDARTRRVRAALRLYQFEGQHQATLYKPDETITLAKQSEGWVVLDRDEHKLGMAPIVRFANRPRTYNPTGVSEITPEIMSITDAACRTLLGLEVAREFYSAPQRYILGADESAFQDAQGNPKTAWETYLGRVLALERDEDGNVPVVGQFQAFDPGTFTKIIDMFARIMSSVTGLPPHVLGYTTDNPASADAIRSSEMRLKLKADRKARSLGTDWRDVAKLALMIQNDGQMPAGADGLTTDWGDTGTPTPAATTDAIAKQIQVGSVPASSDVVLKRLGYSAVERAQLEQDRKEDVGAQFLAELAQSLQAREARVDKSLAADIGGPKAAAAPPIPTSTPNAQPGA